MKVKKVRIVCPALILILNLHMICGDFIFNDLASRMTAAVSRIYQKNLDYVSLTDKQNSDKNFLPTDMIKQNNYPAEVHNVVTEDGYILTLHRIPGSQNSPAVFLQHGLLESSADWLIAGKGRSLAYILSDNGYDVWLGNARGNTYSKDHQTLSTSDPEFWDFSWDQLGLYDLPAAITYISDLKGDSIFYIGHSMAATTFSVMASERPEMIKRVKIMIGLAPATYVYNLRAPVKFVSPFWKEFQRFAYALGLYELLPRSGFFDLFAKYICKSMLLRSAICSNSLFLIAGFDPDQLDYSLLPTIWSKFPAGTSTKLFTHWLQQMNVNKFRKFDYGREMNLLKYNRTEPPDYDLSKLKIPVAVFWSENDWLVGKEDVSTFYRQLPMKLGMYKVKDDKFNHFDFLWALNAPKLVYSKVLELLSPYSNEIRS